MGREARLADAARPVAWLEGQLFDPLEKLAEEPPPARLAPALDHQVDKPLVALAARPHHGSASARASAANGRVAHGS